MLSSQAKYQPVRQLKPLNSVRQYKSKQHNALFPKYWLEQIMPVTIS